ncbi:MAG: hypothetical protein KDI15_02470 [Thiothrix sp.]|nr:hypothetical protein [Thiothrix sp.]
MMWVGSPQFELWRRDPLPIAVYEPASLARRSAVNSLALQGRRYKVVYNSSSLARQIAAVESGLAVAALTRCSIPESFRILGSEHNWIRWKLPFTEVKTPGVRKPWTCSSDFSLTYSGHLSEVGTRCKNDPARWPSLRCWPAATPDARPNMAFSPPDGYSVCSGTTAGPGVAGQSAAATGRKSPAD